MVRFFPPMSLFGHWKCALSLETTLSYLAKSKVDNPPCLKSPKSKKCQSSWTPELENPTQLYPPEIPPHTVTVWLPWWCQQQHEWQRRELQPYHTRKLICDVDSQPGAVLAFSTLCWTLTTIPWGGDYIMPLWTKEFPEAPAHLSSLIFHPCWTHT